MSRRLENYCNNSSLDFSTWIRTITPTDLTLLAINLTAREKNEITISLVRDPVSVSPTLKTYGKREKLEHGPSSACCWRQRRSPIAIASQQCQSGLAGSLTGTQAAAGWVARAPVTIWPSLRLSTWSSPVWDRNQKGNLDGFSFFF